MNRKAFLIGLLSALFFSFTFILNRSMALEGGSFLWTSSLRYLFLLPMFAIATACTGGLQEAHLDLRRRPIPWFLWSLCGFWVFYFFLCLGSQFGNSWLVAGAWQLTIVAGILCTPLFGKPIPKRSFLFSCIIFLGVILLQAQSAFSSGWEESALCILPILLAAFAYPLGNRKLMALPHSLNTLQRIYLMTLCSTPAWLLQSVIAAQIVGLPSATVVLQSLLVSLFSGFIATFLFFYATDLCKSDAKALAITESTIAGEVLFTLLGGVLFLHDPLPSGLGALGLLLILIGMVCNR